MRPSCASNSCAKAFRSRLCPKLSAIASSRESDSVGLWAMPGCGPARAHDARMTAMRPYRMTNLRSQGHAWRGHDKTQRFRLSAEGRATAAGKRTVVVLGEAGMADELRCGRLRASKPRSGVPEWQELA